MALIWHVVVLWLAWHGALGQQADPILCRVQDAHQLMMGLNSTGCAFISVDKDLDFSREWKRDLGPVLLKTNKTVLGNYSENGLVQINVGFRAALGNAATDGMIGFHLRDLTVAPNASITIRFQRLHLKEVIHRGKMELWPKDLDLSFEKCIIAGYSSYLFPRYSENLFFQFPGFIQQWSIPASGNQLEEICGECHGLQDSTFYFHYERYAWSNDQQKVSMAKVANVNFPLKAGVAEDGQGLIQLLLAGTRRQYLTVFIKGLITVTDKDLAMFRSSMKLGNNLKEIIFYPYISTSFNNPNKQESADLAMYPSDPKEPKAGIIFETTKLCILSGDKVAKLRFIGLKIHVDDLEEDTDVLIPCFTKSEAVQMDFVYYSRRFREEEQILKFVDHHFNKESRLEDENGTQTSVCTYSKVISQRGERTTRRQEFQEATKKIHDTYLCLNKFTNPPVVPTFLWKILLPVFASTVLLIVVAIIVLKQWRGKKNMLPSPGQSSKLYTVNLGLLELTNTFLGPGSHGDMYWGTITQSKGPLIEVAVEHVPLIAYNILHHNLSALRLVNHKNLVTFWGAIRCVLPDGDLEDDNMLIISDLMGASLMDTLYNDPQFCIDCTYLDLLRVFQDVACALQHLHDEQGYVHLDIRPSNVVISRKTKEGLTAKVRDFGWVQVGSDITALERGEEEYRGPEIKMMSIHRIGNGCRANQYLDVYSFGVLMWECVMCRQPEQMLTRNATTAATTIAITNRIKIGSAEGDKTIACDCPTPLRELIEKCLQYDTEQAPDHGRPKCDLIKSELKRMQGHDWVNDRPAAWRARVIPGGESSL